MDLAAMKRRDMQALCKRHGLPAGGSNANLAARLAAALEGCGGAERKDLGVVVGKGCFKRSSGVASDGSSGAAKKVTFVVEDEEGSAGPRGRRRKPRVGWYPIAAKTKGRRKAEDSLPAAETSGGRCQRKGSRAGGDSADEAVAEEVAVNAPVRRSRRIAVNSSDDDVGESFPEDVCLNSTANADEQVKGTGKVPDKKQSRKTRETSDDICHSSDISQTRVSSRSTRSSSLLSAAVFVCSPVGKKKADRRKAGEAMEQMCVEEQPADAQDLGRRTKRSGLMTVTEVESNRNRRNVQEEPTVQQAAIVETFGRTTRSISVAAAVMSPILGENKRRRKTKNVLSEGEHPSVSEVPINDAPDARSLRTRSVQVKGNVLEEAQAGKKLENSRQTNMRATRGHQQLATSVENEGQEQVVAPPMRRSWRNQSAGSEVAIETNDLKIARPFTRNAAKKSIEDDMAKEDSHSGFTEESEPTRKSRRKSVLPRCQQFENVKDEDAVEPLTVKEPVRRSTRKSIVPVVFESQKAEDMVKQSAVKKTVRQLKRKSVPSVMLEKEKGDLVVMQPVVKEPVRRSSRKSVAPAMLEKEKDEDVVMQPAVQEAIRRSWKYVPSITLEKENGADVVLQPAVKEPVWRSTRKSVAPVILEKDRGEDVVLQPVVKEPIRRSTRKFILPVMLEKERKAISVEKKLEIHVSRQIRKPVVSKASEKRNAAHSEMSRREEPRVKTRVQFATAAEEPDALENKLQVEVAVDSVQNDEDLQLPTHKYLNHNLSANNVHSFEDSDLSHARVEDGLKLRKRRRDSTELSVSADNSMYTKVFDGKSSRKQQKAETPMKMGDTLVKDYEGIGIRSNDASLSSIDINLSGNNRDGQSTESLDVPLFVSNPDYLSTANAEIKIQSDEGCAAEAASQVFCNSDDAPLIGAEYEFALEKEAVSPDAECHQLPSGRTISNDSSMFFGSMEHDVVPIDITVGDQEGKCSGSLAAEQKKASREINVNESAEMTLSNMIPVVLNAKDKKHDHNNSPGNLVVTPTDSGKGSAKHIEDADTGKYLRNYIRNSCISSTLLAEGLTEDKGIFSTPDDVERSLDGTRSSFGLRFLFAEEENGIQLIDSGNSAVKVDSGNKLMDRKSSSCTNQGSDCGLEDEVVQPNGSRADEKLDVEQSVAQEEGIAEDERMLPTICDVNVCTSEGRHSLVDQKGGGNYLTNDACNDPKCDSKTTFDDNVAGLSLESDCSLQEKCAELAVDNPDNKLAMEQVSQVDRQEGTLEKTPRHLATPEYKHERGLPKETGLHSKQYKICSRGAMEHGSLSFAKVHAENEDDESKDEEKEGLPNLCHEEQFPSDQLGMLEPSNFMNDETNSEEVAREDEVNIEPVHFTDTNSSCENPDPNCPAENSSGIIGPILGNSLIACANNNDEAHPSSSQFHLESTILLDEPRGSSDTGELLQSPKEQDDMHKDNQIVCGACTSAMIEVANAKDLESGVSPLRAEQRSNLHDKQLNSKLENGEVLEYDIFCNEDVSDFLEHGSMIHSVQKKAQPGSVLSKDYSSMDQQQEHSYDISVGRSDKSVMFWEDSISRADRAPGTIGEPSVDLAALDCVHDCPLSDEVVSLKKNDIGRSSSIKQSSFGLEFLFSQENNEVSGYGTHDTPAFPSAENGVDESNAKHFESPAEKIVMLEPVLCEGPDEDLTAVKENGGCTFSSQQDNIHEGFLGSCNVKGQVMYAKLSSPEDANHEKRDIIAEEVVCKEEGEKELLPTLTFDNSHENLHVEKPAEHYSGVVVTEYCSSQSTPICYEEHWSLNSSQLESLDALSNLESFSSTKIIEQDHKEECDEHNEDQVTGDIPRSVMTEPAGRTLLAAETLVLPNEHSDPLLEGKESVEQKLSCNNDTTDTTHVKLHVDEPAEDRSGFSGNEYYSSHSTVICDKYWSLNSSQLRSLDALSNVEPFSSTEMLHQDHKEGFYGHNKDQITRDITRSGITEPAATLLMSAEKSVLPDEQSDPLWGEETIEPKLSISIDTTDISETGPVQNKKLPSLPKETRMDLCDGEHHPILQDDGVHMDSIHEQELEVHSSVISAPKSLEESAKCQDYSVHMDDIPEQELHKHPSDLCPPKSPENSAICHDDCLNMDGIDEQEFYEQQSDLSPYKSADKSAICQYHSVHMDSVNEHELQEHSSDVSAPESPKDFANIQDGRKMDCINEHEHPSDLSAPKSPEKSAIFQDDSVHLDSVHEQELQKQPSDPSAPESPKDSGDFEDNSVQIDCIYEQKHPIDLSAPKSPEKSAIFQDESVHMGSVHEQESQEHPRDPSAPESPKDSAGFEDDSVQIDCIYEQEHPIDLSAPKSPEKSAIFEDESVPMVSVHEHELWEHSSDVSAPESPKETAGFEDNSVQMDCIYEQEHPVDQSVSKSPEKSAILQDESVHMDSVQEQGLHEHQTDPCVLESPKDSASFKDDSVQMNFIHEQEYPTDLSAPKSPEESAIHRNVSGSAAATCQTSGRRRIDEEISTKLMGFKISSAIKGSHVGMDAPTAAMQPTTTPAAAALLRNRENAPAGKPELALSAVKPPNADRSAARKPSRRPLQLIGGRPQ